MQIFNNIFLNICNIIIPTIAYISRGTICFYTLAKLLPKCIHGDKNSTFGGLTVPGTPPHFGDAKIPLPSLRGGVGGGVLAAHQTNLTAKFPSP